MQGQEIAELPRGQKQNQKIKNAMTRRRHHPRPCVLALEGLLAASGPAFRVFFIQTVNRDRYQDLNGKFWDSEPD